MNNRKENENERRHRFQFGGNSVTESHNLLDLLYEIYLEAGLQKTEAWDAALADYTQGFSAAA